MGPFGRGAVGKPSSSTSGRPWASMSLVVLSVGVLESFRRDNWDRLWRRIGGGTASSSLSGSSGGVVRGIIGVHATKGEKAARTSVRCCSTLRFDQMNAYL
jgi:hypothetical protein